MQDAGQIERQGLIQVFKRRFSIDKTCLWTNIAIEARLVDQIPDRLDIHIAAFPEVAVQHVFRQTVIGCACEIANREAARDKRWIEKHIDQHRDVVAQRFAVGVHRKELRSLFDEHAVAIGRNVFVDATLKECPLRPWIDDVAPTRRRSPIARSMRSMLSTSAWLNAFLSICSRMTPIRIPFKARSLAKLRYGSDGSWPMLKAVSSSFGS